MLQRAITRGALAAVLLAAVLVAVPMGNGDEASAATSTAMPVGDVGKFKQRYAQDFRTAAKAAKMTKGSFAWAYQRAWQPYPDGMSGMYYSGTQISAHGGVMDVALSGTKGAAGTFGTPDGAWSHVGGKFSVRARADGGVGNGAAFMLWPTSNVWSDGEIDYPEGNFEDHPTAFHHSMQPGSEWNATVMATGASWRAWHTYSIEWIPGKSVTYLLDGRVMRTVTKDVPTTAHRYMFQVGNWGAPGHLYIDWVTSYEYVK